MSDDDGGGGGRGWFAGFGRTNIKIGGLDEAVSQLKGLTSTLSTLTNQLTQLNQQQSTLTSGLNNMIKGIGNAAASATPQVQGLTNAVGNTKSGSGLVNALFSTASNVAGSDIFKDLAMFPLRYSTQTLDSNRQLAMNVSTALGSQMYATGANSGGVMNALSRLPGNIMGSPEDLIGMVQQMRQYGSFLDFGNLNSQYSGRTTGFLKGVQEAQQITPGTPASMIAQTIGGFSSNTGAQQQSQMLTGGAYAMVAAGGRQKSLSEWADDIMKWLVNLRPGSDKGKPFSYGQLMAQYFPGSNIDAWFNANGVPEGMKEYWWSYALNKSRSSSAAPGEQIGTDTGNQAMERLKAVTSQTRGQFALGSTMAGTYSNKEQSNRWFNDLMAQVQSQVLPAQVSGGSLQATQYLPDALQELMMGMLERGGSMGALIGGGIGYGIKGAKSLTTNLMQMFSGGLPEGLFPTNSMQTYLTGAEDYLGGMSGVASSSIEKLLKLIGGGDTDDYGDVTDYGPTGSTTTAGMHPDMRRKVKAMMRANPKIQINSGLRDTVLQQNLKAKGHSRVSGKPSAHTRGQAADLGPASQYGWIVKNAKKFGLKSGMSQGEPWHVGMGDTDTDDTNFGLGSLLKMFTGGMDKENITGAIGGLVPSIMRLFFGMFGMDDTLDTNALAFDPEVYSMLKGSGSYTLGGLQSSTYDPAIKGWQAFRNIKNDNNSNGNGAPLPTGGGRGSQEAGIRAATALFNAGFRRKQDLETITAISWRESKWDPHARNDSTSDRGLMQLNGVHWRPRGYTEQDMFNIQTNANLAYTLWRNGGADYDSFQQLWGFSESSPYVNGGPGWDKNGDPLARTSGSNAATVVAAANLQTIGDLIDVPSLQNMVDGGNRAPGQNITFANNFVIQAGGSGSPMSNGSIDVRKLTTQIADQLESQMRQRLSRNN